MLTTGSEEQLTAFLTAIMADVELREKLEQLNDLDSVEALAEEAGFDVG